MAVSGSVWLPCLSAVCRCSSFVCCIPPSAVCLLASAYFSSQSGPPVHCSGCVCGCHVAPVCAASWLTSAVCCRALPSAAPAACVHMRRSLDHFSQAAITAGYGSRAVYKLQAINRKHRILRPNDTVVDLGAVHTPHTTPHCQPHYSLPRMQAASPVELVSTVSCDWCQSSGSWSLYAAHCVGRGGRVLAVDILPRPVERR